MPVSALMKSPAFTIEQDATIAEAIITLADEHISALPVVDHAGKLVGMLSTTDILQAASELNEGEGRDMLFDRTTAGDLMTRHVVTVGIDASLHEAARLMLYGAVHRLVVTDNDAPLGVISQTDLVAAFATGRV